MADKFIIEGGKTLNGEVLISGSKNAAAPVLPATLLTEEECLIGNLPLIEDVFKTLKLLESMGVEVDWQGERKVRIKAGKETDPEKLNLEALVETRMSVLLIGPLLARFGSFKFASPGGDKIGLRPIDAHLKGLEKLGAVIAKNNGIYHFDGRNLSAKEVVLSEFSPTATENLMMAAALVPGKTTIKTAAAEPHIQSLGKMLQEMGAEVSGLGSHTIEIVGKKQLNGSNHRVIPDYLETGTFFIAGALNHGEIVIKDAAVNDLDLFLSQMAEIGVIFEKGSDYLKVGFSPDLKPAKIQALPHPGFPTDLLPIAVPLLSQAKGKSLIHDPLYENRLNYIQELRKMGADIEIVDPHRAFVFGPSRLAGIKISSWDIRAGASLLVAGLAAEGVTTLENVFQIDRGYERIEEKFNKLGASVKRVKC